MCTRTQGSWAGVRGGQGCLQHPWRVDEAVAAGEGVVPSAAPMHTGYGPEGVDRRCSLAWPASSFAPGPPECRCWLCRISIPAVPPNPSPEGLQEGRASLVSARSGFVDE